MPLQWQCPYPSRVLMSCVCVGRVIWPLPMAACDQLKTAGRWSWLNTPAPPRSKAVWLRATV